MKTVATTGAGVPELVAAIEQFRAHSAGVQAARRKTRSEYRLRELVSHRFMEHLERDVLGAGELASMVDRIAAPRARSVHRRERAPGACSSESPDRSPIDYPIPTDYPIDEGRSSITSASR